jgi:hypothetical protein
MSGIPRDKGLCGRALFFSFFVRTREKPFSREHNMFFRAKGCKAHEVEAC